MSKLLKPVSRRGFDAIVARHGGEIGAKGFRCRDQLRLMVYAQYSGVDSLRQLEAAWNAQESHHYHLMGPCRRSTLADANERRPWQIYADLFKLVALQASRAMRQEVRGLISILDSSPIPLRQSFFDWAEEDNRIKGLKMHIVYDPVFGRIEDAALTSPKVSDVTQGQGMIKPEAGVTYVFDKGYCDYNWWQNLHEAKAFFVTRLKGNARVRLVRARAAEGGGILSDREIKVGHKSPRAGARNTMHDTVLREITVEREGGKPPLLLVTNDLNRPATEIAALYKQRWEIELLFKWIKQNLNIRSFLGHSENAVRIQIFTALIAHVLLAIMRKASCVKTSAIHFITVVRHNLTSRKNLDALLKPPDKKPKPVNNQNNMEFIWTP